MDDLPVSLNPALGEIWVGDLLLHSDADKTVRFQLVDSNGEAYGKELTLERRTFERRYCCQQGKWRIRLKIMEAERGSILYQQLDQADAPLDEPKRVSLIIFVRNFYKQP